MPPFNVGFAQVEQRLGIVRRRLNSVAVQDAVYLGGSLVALAAALVIAVAVRGRATLFAVAVWAAVAAVVAAVAAAAWRVRRRWMTTEQVVRLADRRAALDDRLATLLLDPPRVRSSRLRDILLEQILAASPSWDVDTIAPRRVPRSAYALLAAVGALVLTTFLARPPARPRPANEAMRARPSSARNPDGILRPHTGAMAGAGPGSMAPGGDHTGIAAGGRPDSASHSPAAQGPGGLAAKAARASAQPDAAKQGAARSQEGASPARGGQAPADARGMPESENIAADGMTAKLQDSIRQALGAPRPDAGDRDEDRGGERPAREGRQPGVRKQSPRSPADPPRQDRAAVQQPGTSEAMPGSGSAANPGARTGPGKELLAKQGHPRFTGKESPSMRIKLGAFAAMQPSQVEPQRQPPIDGVPTSGAPASAPPPLSEEQIPDAPLQKADVAPEHEAVVRRIYTRE